MEKTLKTSKLVISVLLLSCSNMVSAALYEISYISNDYGRLGSFTIDSQDIINNRGNNPLGGNYVLNDFIQDLNFSYNGMKWMSQDISIGTQEAHGFDFVGDIPVLTSANGALAINSNNESIVMYHPSVGVLFGSEYILGNWITSEVTAVPLPAAMWLMLTGLISLFSFRKKHNK